MANNNASIDNGIDYYKILKCERTATVEELKRNYQQLALVMHPDKVTGSDDHQFLLIHKAWSILRDPESRKKYDSELALREHSNHLLYCTIPLSEMVFCTDENIYSYACRCGGNYMLDAKEVQQNSLIVPCDECSFSIQVNR